MFISLVTKKIKLRSLRFISICCLFTALLSLSGCFSVPKSVVILKNPSPATNSLWLNGKELVKLTNDDVELIVNYDSSRQGILIFDVAIQNNTNDMILISPENFYCEYTNRLNENFKKYALNPETLLRNYDTQIERAYAQRKTEDKNNSLFLLFEIAETFQSKTEDERKDFYKKTEERDEQYTKSTDKINSALSSLTYERQKTATEALRKTSLLPGQKLSGKLYFNAYISKGVKNISVSFPINTDTLKVTYETDL